MVRLVAQQPVEVAASEVEKLLAETVRQVAREAGKKAGDKVPLLLSRRGLVPRAASPGLVGEASFWREAALRAALQGSSVGYLQADQKLRVPQ
ncbi:hypothetical protein CDD83_9746 [Cordyceps sp. RAO-2017]|nr:hypothetical protein CDD83_9746 [Cordyceps sp. RAO-2017]